MPNLHPFFVHFPIALLTLGLISDAWATARKDDSLWKFGWLLQAAGTLGLLIAAGTGILAGQTQVIPEVARGIFDFHQQGAFIGASVCSALAIWRFGARGTMTGTRRVQFLILYAAGVGTVLLTSWYGGELVFRFGVGVGGN
jgi:uncharacterized membrane protein